MSEIEEILLKPAGWQLDDWNKAKAQLYKLISDEIIKADEPVNWSDEQPDTPADDYADTRNGLRDTQRTALDKLFNLNKEQE